MRTGLVIGRYVSVFCKIIVIVAIGCPDFVNNAFCDVIMKIM